MRNAHIAASDVAPPGPVTRAGPLTRVGHSLRAAGHWLRVPDARRGRDPRAHRTGYATLVPRCEAPGAVTAVADPAPERCAVPRSSIGRASGC